MRGLIIVIALLLTANVYATRMEKSQPPLSTPAESDQKLGQQSEITGQKSNTDERGTGQSPLVVKVLTNAKTDAEAERDRQEHDQKTKNEKWLVIFNGALVFVIFLQWIWMIRHEIWMRKNVQIAKDAADAATKSAEAAVTAINTAQNITERAYLFGGPGGRRVDKLPVGDFMKQTHISVTVLNYGRTPGFLKKIFFGLCLEEDWSMREKEWPVIKDMHELTWEDPLYPEQKYHELHPIDATALPVEDGKTYISYGRIIYKDVFGKEHYSAWKHRIVQRGIFWDTIPLEGAYTTGWN